jgi:hypothetical protein
MPADDSRFEPIAEKCQVSPNVKFRPLLFLHPARSVQRKYQKQSGMKGIARLNDFRTTLNPNQVSDWRCQELALLA